MACATLKRSLDWESLNQRPTKRRRCLPFGTAGPSSPTSSSSKYVETAPTSTSASSPFTQASAYAPKLTPGKFLTLN